MLMLEIQSMPLLFTAKTHISISKPPFRHKQKMRLSKALIRETWPMRNTTLSALDNQAASNTHLSTLDHSSDTHLPYLNIACHPCPGTSTHNQASNHHQTRNSNKISNTRFTHTGTSNKINNATQGQTTQNDMQIALQVMFKPSC